MWRIGTAGWSISNDSSKGTLLEKYGRIFRAVEINTSFYRTHQEKTYARWAELVPEDFRFSVKLLREYAHNGNLLTSDGLRDWIRPVQALGKKLGLLLVQLPPSLAFRPEMEDFFDTLRELHDGAVAFEPRHFSWEKVDANQLFERWRLVRVEADPEVFPIRPQKRDFRYLRLHGSPVVYESTYEPERLEAYARSLEEEALPAWCIFDNTKLGHATENALDLKARLDAGPDERSGHGSFPQRDRRGRGQTTPCRHPSGQLLAR